MLKIAHRGASGYAPENTLAAFRKALDMHVDMIELDVRMCGSGELVVIHDATVNRTTNGTGKVGILSLTKLQKLDAGNGEKIPTLTEVLTLIGKKAKININLKSKKAVIPTAQLITHYISEKKLQYDDVVISSPNIFYLRTIKKLNPKLNVSVIMRYLPAIHTRIMRIAGPSAIQPHERITTKQFIDTMHKKGLKVFAWTLMKEEHNKKNHLEKIKQTGVDGIITNYPDRI